MHLAENQVQELFEAFGTLRAMQLVKEPGSETSRGYAFVEWADPSVTDTAIEGLNHLDLGEKKLVARRADAHRSGGAAGGGGQFPSVDAGLTGGVGVGVGVGGGGAPGMAMGGGMPAVAPPAAAPVHPTKPRAFGPRTVCCRFDV